MAVQTYSFEGEGLDKSYVCPDFLTGIKNYKPASDLRYMDTLEKHLETDELFMLSEPECILILGVESANGMQLSAQRMRPGHIYAVEKGTWHNVVMCEGAKAFLAERPDTGAHNSEFYPLLDGEKAALRQLVETLA